jgi:hypothetical protein
MYRLLTLLTLVALPAAATAQTVRGVVLEDGSRTRVAGAGVELLDASSRVKASTVTDSLGVFSLRAEEGGRFTIRLTHLSYVPLASRVLELAAGEVVLVELRMGRSAIPLAPLVVTSVGTARLGGFYERRKSSGFGHFITRADIEKQPGTTRATALLQGVPGVRLIPVQRARGASLTYIIATRGAASSCGPAIFINGAPLRQYNDSGIDDFLTANAVEAIEVYPSSAGTPAPFQQPNTCGAVAFWMRTGQEEGDSRMTLKRMAAGLAVGSVLVLLFTSFN